ncbi:hypothetical protein [Amnibacterium kyonggiense]|uniref:hypothetical protein n=1 Tax=Amnibacterium kyonggiense TaxID=595671 RepID=UPI001FE5D7AB|nr:hypothetical protein [Amnibacterium kyonggiense]
MELHRGPRDAEQAGERRGRHREQLQLRGRPAQVRLSADRDQAEVVLPEHDAPVPARQRRLAGIHLHDDELRGDRDREMDALSVGPDQRDRDAVVDDGHLLPEQVAVPAGHRG